MRQERFPPSAFSLPPLVLSRARIKSFLACPRQFQLRLLERRPWPRRPLSADQEARLAKGQAFHQIVQRYFARLDTAVPPHDADVNRWWQAFQRCPPPIPAGDGVRLLPEMSLTILVPGFDGRILLTGRFDLLAVSDTAAHIFDWKTGRPRPLSDLRHDWQTRLYLALLAEGGQAVRQVVPPKQITITYWYAAAPDAPRTIAYAAAEHSRTLADLQAIAAQIEALTGRAEWPLTDDLTHCGSCPFQVICGRVSALAASDEPVEWEPEPVAAQLEPELPQ